MAEPEYTIRALKIPVLRPVDPTWDGDGTEEQRRQLWIERRGQARQVLETTCQVANRLVRCLQRIDCAPPLRDEAGRFKLPPMPSLDGQVAGKSLYLNARDIAPGLQSGSVSQILQDVSKAYMRERIEVFRGQRSVRNYTSYPYPVRRQDQGAHPLVERGGHGGPLEVGIPFADPVTGKIMWTHWRLKEGRRYGRSVAGVRAMARGEVDLRVIYLSERKNAGRSTGEFFVTFIGRFPKRADPEAKGRLLVSTSPEGLLRYATDRVGREGWCRYDQIKRLMEQRRKLTRRLADDMKSERRVSRRQRERMVASNEPRLERINGAIKDALRCAAKEVVNVALRRRCSELVYRDVRPVSEEEGQPDKKKSGGKSRNKRVVLDDSWCPGLAWYELRERIKTLCSQHGVLFTYDEEASMVPVVWTIGDEIRKHLVEEVV